MKLMLVIGSSLLVVPYVCVYFIIFLNIYTSISIYTYIKRDFFFIHQPFKNHYFNV